jgi:hypothetical protein
MRCFFCLICCLKGVRDKAAAMHATGIKLRAERRAGELLTEMRERGERAKGREVGRPPQPAILADFGVSKTQ